MRPAIGRQCHEQNVLFTTPGDCTARSYAAGIGKENNLEQDTGIIGRSTGFIVVEPGIKDGQVKFMIDEITEGVLEGAFLNLFIEEDGNELPLGVRVWFVFGQGSLFIRVER